QVSVFDQLLRDRRSALANAFSAGIPQHRASNAENIQTGMIEKASILDRCDRVHQKRWNIAECELSAGGTPGERVVTQRFRSERKRLEGDIVTSQVGYSFAGVKCQAHGGRQNTGLARSNLNHISVCGETAVPHIAD